MINKNQLVPIVCASDCEPCPDCDEPWCSKCRMHYFECSCIGPHNAEDYGLKVIEIAGTLYGVKDA